MTLLEVLNNKLNELIRRYAEIRTENKHLREQLARQTRQMEQLNRQLEDLENRWLGRQLNDSVMTAEEKIAMRRQLDGVIAEIDKILISIHE